MILVAIGELRTRHGAAVRTVWYFFSLACFATLLVAYWAVATGAIDANGNFQGEAGALVNKLLFFMLDLNADFIFLYALVSLLIVPQLLSYVLSGFFGCASIPLLIESGMAFLAWGIAKSFAVASGILVSYLLVGVWHEWFSINWLSALAFFVLSLLLVSFSFGILHGYYEANTVIKWIRNRCPEILIFLLRRIHKWATRHC